MDRTARRLYRLLRGNFGLVEICYPPGRPGRPGRLTFRTHCPFCEDNRPCLYLDAGYGTYDPARQSDNLDLAVCLGEGCLADWANRRELARQVFGAWWADGADEGLPPAAPPPADAALPPAPPVGDVVPLRELDPGHPAVAYLAGRGYDVGELGAVWGVGYCTGSVYRRMEGRVYIPIFQGGAVVGWQGRWPAEADGPSAEGGPRYYTMPGLRKGQLLYNADVARRESLVVISEGVTDVWRVGPAGVALLGKVASAAQLRLLAAGWPGKPAVVLLDADAAAEAQRLAERLRPLFPSGLVRARLPEGLDPGSCERPGLWALLRAQAADQGVELPPPSATRSS
jgi:hypothetical protein